MQVNLTDRHIILNVSGMIFKFARDKFLLGKNGVVNIATKKMVFRCTRKKR